MLPADGEEPDFDRKIVDTEPGLLVICDHRGVGLRQELAWLVDRGFRVETTRSLRESLLRLRGQPRPDLLLVSSLAETGQIELSTLDRHRNSDVPIPLLVVADPGDDGALVRVDRTLDRGPWDLCRRGAPDEELLLRLERLLDATRRDQEMDRLRHRAFHDDRTNLLRPEAFEARLVEHFSAAGRHHHDLAFVMLDMDRFGQINKVHDHTIGDALITAVGEVIQRTLRTEDVAGRLGGDEFAVLLPYTRKIDAARVVNRLRNEIQKLSGRPVRFGVDLEVSTSIGFETFDGESRDLDSKETLRRHAELALKAAKARGGNCAVYYRSLQEAEAPPEEPPTEDGSPADEDHA